MLPSSRSFLLAAKELSINNEDQLETHITKEYGDQGAWHQKLRPTLLRINAKLGVSQNRTILIKQYLKTTNPQQLIFLIKQLLKHKATQQIHLLHFNLGILYTQTQQITKALFSYEMCLKLQPGFYPSVVNYSNLLKQQNRADQALYYIQRWLTHYKPNYKIQLQYLSLCEEQHLPQVHKMFKNRRVHPFVRYNLGVYLKRIGCQKEGNFMLQSIETIDIIQQLPKRDGDDHNVYKMVSQNYPLRKQRQSRKLSRDLNSEDILNTKNEEKLKQMIKRKRSLNNFYSNAHWIPQNKDDIENILPINTAREFFPKQSNLLTSRVYKMKSHVNNTHIGNVNIKNNSNIRNPPKIDNISKIRSILCQEQSIKPLSRSNIRPINILNIKSRIGKSIESTRKNYNGNQRKRIRKESQEFVDQIKEIQKLKEVENTQQLKSNDAKLKQIQSKTPKIEVETIKKQEIIHVKQKKEVLSKQIEELKLDSNIKQKQTFQKDTNDQLLKSEEVQGENQNFENAKQAEAQLVKQLEEAKLSMIKQAQCLKCQQENQKRQNDLQNQKPQQKQQNQTNLLQENNQQAVSQQKVSIQSKQQKVKQSSNLLQNESALRDTSNLISNKEVKPPAIISNQSQKQKPLLKKKVSYNQKLVTGKYGKIQEQLKQHQQNKKQQLLQKLRQSKQQDAENKAMKSSQHSSNHNKTDSVDKQEDRSPFSRSPDSSFTQNVKNTRNLNRNSTRLNDMKFAKKQTSLKDFSSNSLSSSIMFSDNNPIVKPRISEKIKQKQIKDVVEEVMRIRQSVDIGQIHIEAYVDDKISQAIYFYKQQYKKSTNHKQKISLLLKIGELFEKDKNIQAATRTYQKCIKSQSPQGFLRLGQLQLNKGEVEAAIQNLQKASHFYRTDVRLKLKLAYGYSLFTEGLEKAISITNSLLIKNPSNLQAVLLSSNIYQKQGQTSVALDIISAVNKELINQSIKHYMGLLYLQDINIEDAYQCFRQALAINNKYIPSMIQCATILSINKPKDAIRIFKRVLKAQPKNESALGRLAKIFQTQKQYSHAIQLYKLLLTSIQSYGIYQSLGFCQMKINQHQQAIQHFKRAITFQSNVFCWKMIAQCYETLRQYDKALNYYQVTLKMQSSATSYRKIAVCMIYLEDFKGAIRNLKHSLEIQETLEAYSLMANCHYLANQYDEAINYYKKAASIKGYDTGVYYNMAICYDKKQQFVKSKPLYQRILGQQPDNVKCLFNLANVLLISGRATDALQYFERGLKNNPDNQNRRLQIIELYQILNNLDKAEQHLDYCFKKNPEDVRIVESLLRISRKKKDIKKVNNFTKLLHELKTKPATRNSNRRDCNDGSGLKRSSIENMT